ncbi:acyloxyacyl hydrolase [Denitromonas iodatirespirans]|uniref:Acyloxyacyl hydrolase n=1 Tax=Denitromonas iodatirespirans TaxID=2795389 RepID=A0A944DAX8_DENI1|nr:acyloxyacyl hydrolase [Denitromonas iodatirespirans]MBT0961671.1 acyloxyacyl hydrolase [Denitromonas iodatirespirans]
MTLLDRLRAIKPTAWAVLAFIVAIILGILSAIEAHAEQGFRVALGRTVVNSSATFGEFGYEFPSGWELTGTAMGATDTKRGQQGEVQALSFSRLVRPDWHLAGANVYLRLGVAYVDGAELIGDTNFRLGIGLEWQRALQIEYVHWSSAGIHQPNTGIDGVQLRFIY